MKKYIVIKDYQDGEFGMYRDFTAEQWGQQAYEWADSDDWENPDECLLENFETEKELIDFISEMWELEIIELNKNDERVIEYLKATANDCNGKYITTETEWAKEILKELNK